MKKDIILSGIRPTGRLHIGNYLGALKHFVNLQNDPSKHGFFMVVDLHALTTPFKVDELRDDTLQVVAEYIAAGLDPEKSTIFLQSHVPEHAELTWIFDCITPIGELERMTQYKEKSKYQKESINMGLLNYPVLMAADILLYKPTFVPVGDDQTQHLELARTIARKFNARFGDTFPDPKNYSTKPVRIMSLYHPENKMSKTNDVALMLDDTPEEIRAKLKKAVTATDGSNKSAGVDNLMQILGFFAQPDQVKYFEKEIKNNTIKYSELKEVLADNISEHFAEFREKKHKLLSKPKLLKEILAEGARKARLTASKTMEEVKQKVGLL